MSIDKTCITSVTSTKVAAANSSCTTSDLVALSATVNQLITNRESYVTLACDLPDLYLGATPQGTMFYVRELEVPVVASYTCWLGLDGRLYKDDAPLLQMWGWGRNSCGELGLPDSINYNTPTQEYTSSNDWSGLFVVSSRTSLIKTNGTLWAIGSNAYGEAGNNTKNISYSSPVQEITSSTNWNAVGGNNGSVAAIKTDGTLWLWGRNNQGQLGTNNTICRSSPVQEITSSTNWCLIASRHGVSSIALKTDGTIWGWGFNIAGQLGTNNTISRSSAVQEITSSTNWCTASFDSSTSAIKTDGTLWSWGANTYGNLGDETTVNKSSPVQEVSSSTDWSQVSSGNFHSAAIKTGGTLWAWGINNYGQLGINSNTYYSSPIQEISSSTNWSILGGGRLIGSAIKTDGTLWSWGQGTTLFSEHRLAQGDTADRSSPVQEISSSTNWICTEYGEYHAVGIKSI